MAIAEPPIEILDSPLNTVKTEDVQLDISFDQLKKLVSPRALTGETVLLNMGPQHPSTHGVLRLLLELDGETVVNCIPDIGYLHTGIEKTAEDKTYIKAIPLTDRTDYLAPMSNNLAFCGAVEKLVGIDVPLRAQYLRVILMELTRMNSHLVWLGTHALDIGAMSVFLYCLREREMILDIYSEVSGARMMSSYIRPGGLWRDVPSSFDSLVKKILDVFPGRVGEYEKLLKENPLWKERTVGIGKISAEDAIEWGMTGPCLRGSGVNYDVRKATPYSSYDHFDFSVPLGSNGDVYDRYRCRLEEFHQSLKIIEQAMKKLPSGPVITDDRKVAAPPKDESA
jgi:NADH-quinone oxidoreductase subunit D